MMLKSISGCLATLLVGAVLAADARGAGTSRAFYRCVEPAESVCTATTQDGKAKCSPACAKWSESEIDARWFTESAMTEGTASNFVLANAAAALYGMPRGPKGTGAKIAEVFADPAKHGYTEIDAGRAGVGTLVVLPNISGVVVRGAAAAGDVTIIYASAKAGAPKENQVKYLAGDAQPKFVVPARFASK